MDTAELPARLTRAYEVATARGYRSGLAVVDTSTGVLHAAGEAHREFGTASLVKLMIAARLLVEDRMDDETARLARPMITGSDDHAANVLWAATGGVGIEPWAQQHYGIDGLGSPNGIENRWGNTHVTAAGLARLLTALRRDEVVWPWLGDALHHWDERAVDGSDQCFGLAAAEPRAAVKQGWANGSADDPDNAVVHTCGYLGSGADADRYALVVLTEGRGNVPTTDDCGLDHEQATVVTAMTRQILGARP